MVKLPVIRTVSAEECSSFMWNLMQSHCSTHSVIWVWQPHSTHAHCMASTTPHCVVQWSRHCSHICIPVLSLCISGYINIMQTILIMLTIVGFFLDRSCIPLLKLARLLIYSFVVNYIGYVLNGFCTVHTKIADLKRYVCICFFLWHLTETLKCPYTIFTQKWQNWC